MKINDDLLNKENLYLVGVSGGCDSMALLDILNKLGYRLLVAHVNYNYRHDTDIDYRIVSEYCYKHSIPFYYKECQHDDYKKGNFQDKARELRYLFYKDIYNENKCSGVILGHHLDDHLESIYMQLQKHNTMHYLGIKSYSIVYGMNIYRPLLDCFKDEIINYCKDNNIEYHDDYTNFETDFYRDRVRNTVLNQYRKEDKLKLLEKAKEHNLRVKRAEEKVKTYYLKYKENNMIQYKIIPQELIDIFLYLILKDVINPKFISLSLIEEMKHQMKSHKPNIQMNLPVNYLFIKEYDNIYINSIDDYGYYYVFDKLSSFECDYFSIKEEGHINEGVYLSEDEFPIVVRTMKNGDSMITSGGTKKLSRLFINAKVPALARKSWPVVENNEGKIILIPHIAKNIDYLTTKPNFFVIK